MTNPISQHGWNQCGWAARCAAPALVAALSGCQHPDLAATNVVNAPGAWPIIDATQATGTLEVDTVTVSGIRSAMAQLSPGATITFFPDPASLPVGCTGNAPCLQLQYGASPELLENLVTSPSVTLPSILVPGVDIAVSAANLARIDQLRQGPPGSPFQLQIIHQPQAIRIDAIHTQVAGGAGAVGPTIWFPFQIVFPQDPGNGFARDYLCDCTDPALSGLPESACNTYCTDPNTQLGDCNTLQIRIKINRARFLLGFGPKRFEPGDRTASFAPMFLPGGGKAFHPSELFTVERRLYALGNPLAASEDTYGSDEDAFTAVATDQEHDVAVGVIVENCSAFGGIGCDAEHCDQRIARFVADQVQTHLSRALWRTIDKTISNNDLFTFDKLPFPPPSAPCDIAACTNADLRTLLAASLTYQIDDWFYSPFGPYTNGGFLPVTDMEWATLDPNVDGENERTDRVFAYRAFPHDPVPIRYRDSRIRFTYDNDMDGDGILTPFDSCPFHKNNGWDLDGDGIDGACDLCPCDPDNDSDHDGLCAIACPQQTRDNCGRAFNPVQQNCNPLSEEAQIMDEMGDHCDPVPCPDNPMFQEWSTVCEARCDEEPRCFSFPGGECPPDIGSAEKISIFCGTAARDRVKVQPLASHGWLGAAIPVDVPATEARFCQKDLSNFIRCDDPEIDIQDELLYDFGAVTSVSQETIDTHFHRVTFVDKNQWGLPIISDPDDPRPEMVYDRAAGSKDNPVEWTWNYAGDYARWTDPLNPLINEPGSITGLKGTFWLHAATPVGNSVTDIGSGTHGDELANNHQVEVVPHGETRCYMCMAVNLPDIYVGDDAGSGGGMTMAPPGSGTGSASPSAILWRPGRGASYGSGLRTDAQRGEAEIIVRADAELNAFGAVNDTCGSEVVNDRLSAGLRTSLADPSLLWANAVEPFAWQGAGESFPLAIAMERDGSKVAGAVALLEEGLLLSFDDGLPSDQPGPKGSPSAIGFVPVLSRVRRGVFVVGGMAPTLEAPTGRIWFAPLGADLEGGPATGTARDRWMWVPGFQAERVLAATYSFATDELYVLQERTRRGVELIATRRYDPEHWLDAERSLEEPLRFAVPSEIPVIAGNAGNHGVTLQFDDATFGQTTCFYTGGADDPHPTSRERLALGARYVFAGCDSGAKPGELAVAIWITLHVDEGDASDPSGQTAVRLVLEEAAEDGASRAPDGQLVVELVRLNLRTYAAASVGVWPRHGEWSRQWLVVDADGGLLLASASPAARRHAIARIDVQASGSPAIAGIARGDSALVLPPVADALGYVLVLRQEAMATDPRVPAGRGVRRERRNDLGLEPATWLELGDQL